MLAQSPNDRPNIPIRPLTPITRSPSKVSNQPPPWTRKHLEDERTAFFDTRVSGNDEVWKALRVVCELVRNREIAEAQGILDALNITCPTGRIARDRGKHGQRGGVYDERGQLYDIPAWVVTDPDDIIEDMEKDTGTIGATRDEEAEAGVEGSSPPKDEKGKGRAEDRGEILSLRARLSNTGSDVKVKVGSKEQVVEAIRQIQQQIGPKRVRLMYLGKTLDEHSVLDQTPWKPGHVVNALVFEGDEKMLSKKPSK